ncbi:ABC transporter substrate-binding protein [Nocardioides sp. L-11A]|uniref:ABC transporter substrate-binding protein n=1 Tax=Nocardioides sp. L-11A TaxID=3043848 RepID=UPI002499C804|nr:ABC transporter substrate-binding protein [Nocardioides sp. L-11A]
MKTLTRCVAAVALTLPLAACGGGGAESDATPVTLVVPGPSCLNLYPLRTGIAEGIFEDVGIDLTVQVVQGSPGVLQALVSGKGDIGLPAPQPVVAAQANGADVSLFANVYARGSFRIIALDSGAGDLDDLRGKVIGVEASDGGETAYLHATMAGAGMTAGKDYEVKVVGDGGSAVAGFERSDIDAYAASNGAAATIRAAGVDTVDLSPPPSDSGFGNGLAAKNSWLDENRDTAEAVGRAFRQAAAYASDDVDAVLDACRETSPQEVEDRAYAEALLAAAAESMTPIDDDAWGSWRESGITTFLAETERQLGLAPGTVTPDGVFRTDLLEAINR